ncbi:hypothetical protein GCM10008929_01350 [Alkalibacterium psychrotolerans]
MLKYSELTEEDKRKRHKMIMHWPAFLITIFLMFSEVNYAAIMTMYTGLIVIELVIFGLLDIKFNYSLKELLIDTMYLLLMTLTVVYLVTPLFLYLLNDWTATNYIFTNSIRLAVSFIYYHLFWYSYINLSIKIKKNPLLKWKWEVTRLIASDKKRFAVK